jgi:PPOX class probable F420-dependent enzyme
MPRAPVPPELADFLAAPRPSVVAVVRPDGSPVTAATWYEWLDGSVLVPMLRSSRRLAHIRRDPRVALTVLGDSWYTQVSVLGRVVEIREDGFEDIDRMSMSYFGAPYTPRDAEIASVRFEVERWHAWLDENQRG